MCRIFFILLFLLIGCAPVQNSTQPLIESQSAVSLNVSLKLIVIDGRSQGFKDSYSYAPKTALASTFGAGTAIGDKSFDRPLNEVFNDMVTARFGSHDNGVVTEIRLKEFAVYFRRNPMAYIPFISFFFIAADTTWDGTLSADVAVIGQNGKYSLQQSYEYVETEKFAYDANFNETHLGMLQKVFEKFAQDFEQDFRRTMF